MKQAIDIYTVLGMISRWADAIEAEGVPGIPNDMRKFVAAVFTGKVKQNEDEVTKAND